MQSDPKKLTKAHHELTHSEDRKVMSHTQREQDDWLINSIMIEDCEVPFKFKRKSKYKTLLKGQRINLTYYPKTETVAGLDFETMRVVRIKSA